MTVIVFAPHPDDEVLGVGGTLAKYAAAGERTVVIVFSGGTASHPLHKQKLIISKRREEALAAHKELNVSESIFLELQDLNLKNEIIEKELIPKLYEIIKKEKPRKLFIPTVDDLHSDHRAVTHAILQLYTQYSLDCDVYAYSNWNPIAVFRRDQPRLVVDISESISAKQKAIKAYKSQWVSIYQLVPIITIKTFFSGLRYGYRWAEVFSQVR